MCRVRAWWPSRCRQRRVGGCLSTDASCDHHLNCRPFFTTCVKKDLETSTDLQTTVFLTRQPGSQCPLGTIPPRALPRLRRRPAQRRRGGPASILALVHEDDEVCWLTRSKPSSETRDQIFIKVAAHASSPSFELEPRKVGVAVATEVERRPNESDRGGIRQSCKCFQLSQLPFYISK